MKKIAIMMLAGVLLSTSAFAVGITGTLHDLSSTSGNTIIGGSDEICVYCHTPHGGLTGGFAPLWNRNTLGGSDPTGFYTSSTMDAAPDNNGILNSDAVLCMTCHDGASIAVTLRNPPNSGGGNPATQIVSGAVKKTNLGLDMSNDHPVGFVYADASTTDLEINDPPLNALTKVTYGTANNELWCSSCHDVHNNANPPFLAMDNAGSALCLSCHSK